MGRRHRLFPKASLVQVPPKGLCYHSKSVLLPCPPHRIAPLWERDHLPRAEKSTKFNDQSSSTQLPLHPHRRTATLPWLKHPATNSVPLPYLKYQGTTKPSPCPCHPDPSVLSLPNSKFRERANVALGTPSICVKTPLHPKHKAETPVALEHFPTILRSQKCQKEEPPHLRQKQSPVPFPEHRSEEWPHLKQQPPHLKYNPRYQAEELSQHRQKFPSSPPILTHQLETTSLMDHKTKAMGEPSVFSDPQASARPAPVSSSHSTEAAQNHKHQVRILTFMLGGGGTNLLPKCLILESPCKNHNSKTDIVLEKASDLDYLVNEASRHPGLAFRETALPFLSLNQQSRTWVSPSSRPKYVSRSTSTEAPWPQFNAMFTNIISPDPNHQARVTMIQSRGFILSTRAASDPSLSLGTRGTSGPFQCPEHAVEASLGPDYNVKDTTGPPSHSEHKVKIPPPGVDHFNEVSPDLSHQATISMGPERRTSPSVVLSSGPTATSRSKTQVKTPSFPPINQIESLPCPRLSGRDSLTLEYKSRGPAGVGQQVEVPVDPDNQVTPSLCPEQQARSMWSPDCQTSVTLSLDDHTQLLNIFDHQEKEPPASDTQDNHELGGPQYQTQTAPGPHEIIPPVSDKTKAIPPLGHTTETESQAKKAIQPASPPKQAIPQLCPDYWMIPPQTIADRMRETMPDTSAQVTPYQTEVDFRKTMPQDPDHQSTTLPCQDDGAAPSQGIDCQVITPPCQEDTETSSLGIDHQVITPPGLDDNEKTSLGIGHQVIISSGQGDDSEIPSLGIDHQVISPPGQDDSETPSLGIDHQDITPPGQDDNSEIPSLGIDHQVIGPPGQDDSETPSLGIDHQVKTPSVPDDNSEIPSLGLDHQVITPPWQYDSETPSLDIDHQDITPPWQNDSETSSLGIDHQVKTPSVPDDNSEIPSLGLDHQVITPPWQYDSETPSLDIDHQDITPPGQDDDSETPSLGTDHQIISPPWQDDSETPSLGIGPQVITPSGQDDNSEMPSLGIDHQIISPPWQDDSEAPSLGIGHQVSETSSLGIDHQVISLSGQDDSETTSLGIDRQVSETPSLGIDHQVISPPGQDDSETPLLGIDHQDITPLGKEDNSETPPLGIDCPVISPPVQDDNSETPSLGINHQVITPPRQEDTKTPSLGIEYQVITPPRQDGSETPSLSIDHQVIMPTRQNDSETPSLGIDHQVITPPGQDDSEILSLGMDHQVTTPPCQDDGAVPSQDIDHEVTALPDSDHLTIATPNLKLGAVLEPSEHVEVTPLHDLDHEANTSVRPEYQNTTSFGHNNQVEIGSDTNNNQSTLPAGKDDQVIPFLMPKKKTIPLSTLNHQKDAPADHGHCQVKASMTSYHKDKAQSGFQNQIVKKREIPWHLKYIKPYTIEGRDNVSSRTVRAIINSIPEEKIKRDICKQILFRLMKESPRQKPGECMSTSYSICLECASWVPNGCLHDKRTKRQFEAEMLAIPMPLPGSEEEMGLKFVLRVPYKPFSFFSQLFPELNIQWPLYYAPYFPSFSHKNIVFQVPAKAKWLDYSETDNYPWKTKTSRSHQSLMEENLSILPRESIPTGKENNEKEKSKGPRKGFKSLLEKFQRLRQN
ncbi:uncharacterized protein LOC118835871 isoform X2 [Trichosurus vulpecula]|uniref:uncharacterized protein LOC118835871 isoform X2 n=1 Tax=Trichosurus vulpecula TaxID=9337 RepID=UPI00186B3AC8|nr:uncharacterized protein LOC118835871 isoform X2 [Trichosurus vulpecula]